ncbi:hypothetical protein ACFLX9_03720 [Chloroflexota bacterium]
MVLAMLLAAFALLTVQLVPYEAVAQEPDPTGGPGTGGPFPVEEQVVAAGQTVINFDDLEVGEHSMSDHNPYKGGTYTTNLYHLNNQAYGQPKSPPVFLFNWYGVDNQNVTFEATCFDGLWVRAPHANTGTFWTEGWLGTTKVGESAHVALSKDTPMQFLASGVSTEVDKVVFRIPGGSRWFVIDNLTFRDCGVDLKPVLEVQMVPLVSYDHSDLFRSRNT